MNLEFIEDLGWDSTNLVIQLESEGEKQVISFEKKLPLNKSHSLIAETIYFLYNHKFALFVKKNNRDCSHSLQKEPH